MPTAIAQGDSQVDHRAAVEEAIESVLHSFQDRAGFPGGAIGYVLSDGTYGSVSVGLADRDANVEMNADHRLCAGSVGKTLFAALALLLVEDGTISLDAKISDTLGDRPWFNRLGNGAEITVRHLLNHSSGLPRYVTLPQFQADLAADPLAEREPEELITYILDEPAHFPPGKGFSYADTNYIILGMVIEAATERTCHEQIEERILQPLELKGIVAQKSPDIPNLANGYVNPAQNLVGLETPNVLENGRMRFNPQFEWAGGGFATTPRDLARWIHALHAGNVLKPETKELMHRGIDANMLEPGEKYGLGVMIRQTAHGIAYGHSGYFPGYLTDVFHYPDHGVTLAIQVNSTQLSAEFNFAAMRAALDACVAKIGDHE